ncbi:hypothetical protein GQF42_33935 [Streptomyces broussonetiae]|uniref:BcpO-related WXXGXW repeat protein n=1 Tax=Streptomyces broussonetiae TaxID=2686304 RepID=A0A6I6NA75_9ACTN|nr:hypothetical protein [Streptomyces broussonetiae]QHA07649.1 hypothetical protein GQF42_33935 [Streptomyces broussonetiae]
MKKLTKRIAVAVSSVAIAGVAVIGAGGTASAATPSSAHVQRPAVGVNPAAYRWDHGIGYLIEQGYCWDENRGWHHDERVTDSSWHSRDGRCYWSDEGRGWKSDRSYRHSWNRYEHDGRDWDRHGGNHGDRNYGGWDHFDRNHGDR